MQNTYLLVVRAKSGNRPILSAEFDSKDAALAAISAILRANRSRFCCELSLSA